MTKWSRWSSSSIADDDAIGTGAALMTSSGEGASVVVVARVGVLSRETTVLLCDEDAELTAVLLPTVVCESFLKSNLREEVSDPFTMSTKRTGDCNGVREDVDWGVLKVFSKDIPSASSILRFAGLKGNGAPGLLFPDLNGLFGLEGRNCSKGHS